MGPKCIAAALSACVALAAAGCSASSSNGKGKSEPKAKEFQIFVTTEMKGQIEPCGCNSDPMGDLARTAALIAEARKAGPVLVVDGGSFLYSAVSIPDTMDAQEELKADLLVQAFTDKLGAAAIGLGPYDLSKGTAKVRPARHAVNLGKDSGVPTEPPKVIEVGGVEVGIFGVVEPIALDGTGVEATDPIPAARLAVADLEKKGAQVIIALAHMPRAQAQELARKVEGIDFVVVGQNAPAFPEQVQTAPSSAGKAWLVQPADRGQVLTRLEVSVRDTDAGFSDAIGQERAAVEIAALEGRLQALRNDLSKWKSDPDADPAFVKTKENEVPELEQAIARLEKTPLQVPADGNWFAMAQVPIKRGLPCDPAIQAAKTAYDKQVGKANVEAAADLEPPEPAEGMPGFVGTGECRYCHAEAVEFWKKTRHHEAWETLVEVNKEFNYDCIGCHVTGWDQPGGSTLAHNDELRDVQCEVCHGPGSIHVDEDGKETPKTLVLAPAETVCIECHNKEHSDTFDYTAYLRDVTGPGHGAEFRERLGDGPTGGELRRAALEKAGLEIGEGCLK